MILKSSFRGLKYFKDRKYEKMKAKERRDQALRLKQEEEERRLREEKIQKEKELLSLQRKSGERRTAVRVSILANAAAQRGESKILVI
jgi:hypothetical protein